MPRVLLINANTTQGVTGLIEHYSRAAVDGMVEFKAVTAAFGAAYVASEAAYAVAGHAALDCLEREAGGCDAVYLACFGDPGLFALREASPLPVVGMAEASMREAASRGRFSIVTGGAAWKPILERLAMALGFSQGLVSVRTLAMPGPQLAAHPELIAQEIKSAEAEGAKSIIIGGAALAGLARKLESRIALIDSVECGARAAARLCSRT